MRSRRPALLLGWGLSLGLLGQPALGLVVVAPPEVEPERSVDPEPIVGAILAEFGRAGYEIMRAPRPAEEALRACKGKKKCVATEGAALKASHVVHAVIARREGEALIQLSLVSVAEAKIVATARVKAELNDLGLAVAATQGARSLVTSLPPKTPELPEIGAAPVPMPELPRPAPSPSAAPMPLPSASPAAAEPTTVALTEVTSPPRSTERVASLVLGGVGTALIAASVTSFILAHADASTYNQTPQVEVAAREGAKSRAQAEVNASAILLSGAGVAVATAVVLWFVGEP